MPSARDGRNLLTSKERITVYYPEWRGKDIVVASKNICKFNDAHNHRVFSDRIGDG